MSFFFSLSLSFSFWSYLNKARVHCVHIGINYFSQKNKFHFSSIVFRTYVICSFSSRIRSSSYLIELFSFLLITFKQKFHMEPSSSINGKHLYTVGSQQTCSLTLNEFNNVWISCCILRRCSQIIGYTRRFVTIDRFNFVF